MIPIPIPETMSVRRALALRDALEREMTPQARDESEGATERRELAEGKCQRAWRNYPHVSLRQDDPTVYRQHRCGREHGHRGVCRCRYCQRERSAD